MAVEPCSGGAQAMRTAQASEASEAIEKRCMFMGDSGMEA
jgi:hypothetical protein